MYSSQQSELYGGERVHFEHLKVKQCTYPVSTFSVHWLLMSLISISLKDKGRVRQGHTKVIQSLSESRCIPIPTKSSRKGEGSTQKAQTTATQRVTANGFCAASVKDVPATGRIVFTSRALGPFLEKEAAFHSPSTLRLGGFFLFALFFKPPSTYHNHSEFSRI